MIDKIFFVIWSGDDSDLVVGNREAGYLMLGPPHCCSRYHQDNPRHHRGIHRPEIFNFYHYYYHYNLWYHHYHLHWSHHYHHYHQDNPRHRQGIHRPEVFSLHLIVIIIIIFHLIIIIRIRTILVVAKASIVLRIKKNKNKLSTNRSANQVFISLCPWLSPNFFTDWSLNLI